jgi:hypothetical protein
VNAHASACWAQNEPAMCLAKRVKKPAVACAARCDPRPMAAPLSAAARHGEAGPASAFDSVDDGSTAAPELTGACGGEGSGGSLKMSFASTIGESCGWTSREASGV